jgi:hypothetical protein
MIPDELFRRVIRTLATISSSPSSSSSSLTAEAARDGGSGFFHFEAHGCVSGGSRNAAQDWPQHVNPDAFVIVGCYCGA